MSTEATPATLFGLALPLTYRGARPGEVYQAVPGDPACPVQPAESCDACGQSILEVHVFVDATGRQFKTGCQCVYRYLPATTHGAVKREHARLDREKRQARNAKRRAARAKQAAGIKSDLRAAIEMHADRLAAQPHPLDWRAARGETRLDWAEWMLANAGLCGHSETLAYLRTLDPER